MQKPVLQFVQRRMGSHSEVESRARKGVPKAQNHKSLSFSIFPNN